MWPGVNGKRRQKGYLIEQGSNKQGFINSKNFQAIVVDKICENYHPDEKRCINQSSR
jgi:hypothetical protein